MRDDFPPGTKDALAKRVGYLCSSPSCRQATSGPQEDAAKVINVGVACHVSAASPGGPRYDSGLTAEERSGIGNGIWLCQTCAKLIDNDPLHYTTEILREWRRSAEAEARRALEARRSPDADRAAFSKIEGLMPGLLAEMRQDLAQSPLCREFIALSKRVIYNNAPNKQIFSYYYEDHDQLDGKLRILQNLGLIRDIQFNRVPLTCPPFSVQG